MKTKVKVGVFGRDNVPHTNDPEPDFSVIYSTIANITTELRTAFPEVIPILPVLGNHDAYPKVYHCISIHREYSLFSNIQYIPLQHFELDLSKSLDYS